MNPTNLPIDKTYLTQTLIDLVRINSINPRSHRTDGPGETEIGAYMAKPWPPLGLEVRTRTGPRQRQCRRRAARDGGNGRSLLLNAHMDTVGVDGMTIDPFGSDIREVALRARRARHERQPGGHDGGAKAFVDGGRKIGRRCAGNGRCR